MRKSALFLTLVVAVATGAAQDGLPTADQVVDKYVQALGGKAAIEKLNSRYLKGTVEVTTYNTSGTFEAFEKAPAKRVLKSEFEGYGLVVQACDGTIAWADTPDNGLRDLSGPELAAQKRSSDFYAPLHMRDHYPKLAVSGKAKVGTRDAYVVDAAPSDGSPVKHFFDVENGLLLRVETQANEGTVAVTFEDYKEVDGTKLAMVMKIDMPNVNLIYKTAEVKHQVAIEDAKFAKPAGK